MRAMEDWGSCQIEYELSLGEFFFNFTRVRACVCFRYGVKLNARLLYFFFEQGSNSTDINICLSNLHVNCHPDS